MKIINHISIIVCMFTVLCKPTYSQQQVTQWEAKSAAINALSRQTTITERQTQSFQITEKDIKRVNSSEDKAGNTLIYEIVFENGQAVVLSGSKACLPVLGFALCLIIRIRCLARMHLRA